MEKNQIAPISETGINVFGSIEGFETGMRMAKVFSTSTLAPQAFQNNIGNCMIALNMALRMKADPLMVMQSLFIIHGKPSFEAKFLIACFNASGKYSSIRYEFTGKEGEDSWGCTAYAIEKETGDVLKGTTVTLKMAKDEGWYSKPGSKWKTMPGLMLQYRSATFLIRTVAPEISLGFQTTDEIEDAVVIEEKVSEPIVNVQAEIEQNANKETLAIQTEETPSVNEQASANDAQQSGKQPSIFND